MIALLFLSAVSVFAAIPAGDTATNFIGMKFKRIPAGTFEMGFEGRPLTGMALYHAHTALGIYDEHPRHTVTFSRDFFMGVCEVTNAQLYRFRPNHGKDIPWYPNDSAFFASQMSWYRADSFCQWLTANDPNGWTYRLPTEAEWEYCCRAGTDTWFSTGDTINGAQANVAISWGSSARAQAPGLYPSNPWGLYDMHGNAQEWCLDWYGPYPGNAVTDPGGRDNGDLRCVRGMVKMPFIRTVSRGAKPPLHTTQNRDGYMGFRVVISPLPKDSLNFIPGIDTLLPYQRRVAASRPAPLLDAAGERFTDPDGREFVRARKTQSRRPSQWDSVYYVSVNTIAGDSGATRVLAGQVARVLSERHGVLYRLSNRYELESANLPTGPGEFRLTIIPDVKYIVNGWGHPDVSVFKWRKLPVVDTTWQVGGPLYWDINIGVPTITEAPNGDLLMTFYSGITEDCAEQNHAISRLRYGENDWDPVTSAFDLPGSVDWGTFYKNMAGRLFHVLGMFYSDNWMARYSDDNGVTWSPFAPNRGMLHTVPLGGDTLFGCLWVDVRMSADGGMNCIDLPNETAGKAKSFALTDDGLIREYVRSHNGGGRAFNSDSVETMAQYVSGNFGQTWTVAPTPFGVVPMRTWNVAIKLHSGRLLFAITGPAGSGGQVMAESEDQGKTWFCRRILPSPSGGLDSNRMGTHKGMVQGKDGLIHISSQAHDYAAAGGDQPQITFSEQWLKEGSCIDVSVWGINTAGMVATCPTVDTLHVWRGGNTAREMNAGADPGLRLTAAPNPFNPAVRFIMTPGLRNASLKIYDCAGALTADLSILLKNNGSVEWDARNLSSGLYIAVAEIPGKRIVRTLVLAK